MATHDRGGKPGRRHAAWVWLVAASLITGLACGGATPDPATIARPPTGELIGWLPPGADLVVELDLGRVRDHVLIAPLFARWVEQPQLAAQAGASSAGALADARTVVLASYGAGTDTPALVTLVQGPSRDPRAYVLTSDQWVLAPEPMVAKVRATRGRATGGAATWMRRAQPAGATGAVVRAYGTLGMDARIALAPLVGWQIAPRRFALWADVADDAALVGWFDPGEGDRGSTVAERASMQGDLRRWLGRVARGFASTGLGPALRAAKIETHADGVRVVIVVGPARLRDVIGRARQWFEAAAGSGTLPGNE